MFNTGPFFRNSFLAACIGASGPAYAQQTSSVSKIQDGYNIGGYTSPPIGHMEFCRTHTAECAQKTSNPEPEKMTGKLWRKANAVNTAVNKEVAPMLDSIQYNKEEMWTYPGKYGDCEDYVLEKQRRLIKAGVKPSSLVITVLRQKSGDGHAVLTLRSDKGDFILDNLVDTIKTMAQSQKDNGYTFLKRVSEYDSGKWVSIRTAPDTQTASTRGIMPGRGPRLVQD